MSTTTLDGTPSVQLGQADDHGIARLTLCGGKGNILTGDVMRQLRSRLRTIENDRDVKAVILAGEGKHFSFGASVEEHRREEAAAMIHEFHGLILDVACLDIPIISAVSGMCLGGALELALAGNMIFADATAVFGQPEIQLGVFAPPASILLPLRLGYARAEELLITGENIDAARALHIGLINRLFPSREELDVGIDEWVTTHLLPKSASSLRMAVRAERMTMVDTLTTMLPRLERLYVDELMETIDANEGISSFLEKRAPQWKNQ